MGGKKLAYTFSKISMHKYRFMPQKNAQVDKRDKLMKKSLFLKKRGGDFVFCLELGKAQPRLVYTVNMCP